LGKGVYLQKERKKGKLVKEAPKRSSEKEKEMTAKKYVYRIANISFHFQ